MLWLVKLPAHLGYLILFALVGAESTGVPVPGETALITAGVLAHHGEFEIQLVIVVAAAGAIVGDNVGYLIGRTPITNATYPTFVAGGGYERREWWSASNPIRSQRIVRSGAVAGRAVDGRQTVRVALGRDGGGICHAVVWWAGLHGEPRGRIYALLCDATPLILPRHQRYGARWSRAALAAPHASDAPGLLVSCSCPSAPSASLSGRWRGRRAPRRVSALLLRPLVT